MDCDAPHTFMKSMRRIAVYISSDNQWYPARDYQEFAIKDFMEVIDKYVNVYHQMYTSGISVNYIHILNNHKLLTMKKNLERLSKENQNLKEKGKKNKNIPSTMENALDMIYHSIAYMLKEVNNIELEELDNDVVDEIKSSCKQILETLRKEEELSVEVDHSSSSEDEGLTLEVESSDGSFENLSSIDKDSDS